MSNDVRTESRLSRVKVEVVSGGTQAEETPQATRTTMIVGALAWLALFVVRNRTAWDLLMAGSVVATLPVLIVFLIFQRHFVRGIAMSGLK